MGKIQNIAVRYALHAEVLAAVSDLAKSMAIAVARMLVRAQFTAAIADAEKAERAAQALYFATAHSTEMAKQEQTAASVQQDNSPRDAHASTIDALDELYAACSRLETALVPRAEPEDEIHPTESVIAMRIVQLQDRLGGFIKQP